MDKNFPLVYFALPFSPVLIWQALYLWEAVTCLTLHEAPDHASDAKLIAALRVWIISHRGQTRREDTPHSPRSDQSVFEQCLDDRFPLRLPELIQDFMSLRI